MRHLGNCAIHAAPPPPTKIERCAADAIKSAQSSWLKTATQSCLEYLGAAPAIDVPPMRMSLTSTGSQRNVSCL